MTVARFEQFLKSKNIFKLICGAGNKNFDEITKLCRIYATAGCRFFDVNASVEAVRAAKKGIKEANKENDCYICVSIGTKNDPHLNKCKINPDKCIKCHMCEQICNNEAIKDFKVVENNCIGCNKCFNVCKSSAIEVYQEDVSFSEILPEIIEEGIDCIEFHIITNDKKDILNKGQEIANLYDGPVSICQSRAKLGDEDSLSVLEELKSYFKNLFIIQADGFSLSGGDNTYRETIQAVAMTDFIEKANLTNYIFISGGTNSKTMELVRQCKINVTGMATGSYARKIVKNYMNGSLTFEEAVEIAKNYINTIKE